jgi:hypothetical protein
MNKFLYISRNPFEELSQNPFEVLEPLDQLWIAIG